MRRVGWLLWFNGISIFVGYLTPNAFLYRIIQFSMSTQFYCKITFLYQTIQFIQIVLIQLIQFSISTGFVYTQLMVKYTSEFESHWVPLSYGLVPHLSKKLSKFPQLMVKTVLFQTIQLLHK